MSRPRCRVPARRAAYRPIDPAFEFILGGAHKKLLIDWAVRSPQRMIGGNRRGSSERNRDPFHELHDERVAASSKAFCEWPAAGRTGPAIDESSITKP